MLEKVDPNEVQEVTFDSIEELEQTEAPAFGVICGGGCWGIGCAL